MVHTSADKLSLLPFCRFMQKICQHIVIIDWFNLRLFSDEWCRHNWWLSSNTNTIQAIPKSMVTEGVHKVQLFTRSLRKIVKLGVKIYKFIKVLRVAELCWNIEWCWLFDLKMQQVSLKSFDVTDTDSIAKQIFPYNKTCYLSWRLGSLYHLLDLHRSNLPAICIPPFKSVGLTWLKRRLLLSNSKASIIHFFVFATYWNEINIPYFSLYMAMKWI